MKPVQTIIANIEKNLVDNGTIDRIDARAARQTLVAQWLGFANAQAAFNKLGKPFLKFAEQYLTIPDTVAHAIGGFITLVSKDWQTQLAFDCSHDGVFDEVDKEEFLNLCQSVAKERARIQ